MPAKRPLTAAFALYARSEGISPGNGTGSPTEEWNGIQGELKKPKKGILSHIFSRL